MKLFARIFRITLGLLLTYTAQCQEEPIYAELLRVKYAQENPNFKWHQDSTWLCILENSHAVLKKPASAEYCLCNSAGRTLDTLYSGPTGFKDHVYSPDISKIAMTNRGCELGQSPSGSQLVILDVRQKNATTIGCWIWANAGPQCWSPDGRTIVLNKGRDEDTLDGDVLVLDIQTETFLDTISNYRVAAWHPTDSQSILLGNDEEVVQYHLGRKEIVASKSIPDGLKMRDISWDEKGRHGEIHTYEYNPELKYRSASRTLKLRYVK